MANTGIRSAGDIADFFTAYNERRYDLLFEKYMSEDCSWYASEKLLKGKEKILNYWTTYHAAFSEKLGTPENVVFGDGRVYLQVKIQLDFIEDGTFFGRAYEKGERCTFGCVDYYELDEDHKIRSGLVYIKFFN